MTDFDTDTEQNQLVSFVPLVGVNILLTMAMLVWLKTVGLSWIASLAFSWIGGSVATLGLTMLFWWISQHSKTASLLLSSTAAIQNLPRARAEAGAPGNEDAGSSRAG